MISAVDEALAIVDPLGVRDAVLRGMPEQHCVCDDAFAAWFASRRRGSADGAMWRVSTLDELDAAAIGDGRRVLVCTLGDEAALRREVAARLPGTTPSGLLRDVLPRRTAGLPIDAPRRTPDHWYVIVCAPRCGSYFLASLLRRAGLGAPAEHVQTRVCELARRGWLDLRRFFDDLGACTSAHGWFGTKLVSSFLCEVFDAGLPLHEFGAYLEQRDARVLYLYREDKFAQAVSNYIARQTDRWVVAEASGKLEIPAYDFDEIRADHTMLVAHEAWLEEVQRHLPRVLRVRYEDLDRETERVLGEVCEHLGAPAPGRVEAGTRKLRDARSREYAARFRRELGG